MANTNKPRRQVARLREKTRNVARRIRTSTFWMQLEQQFRLLIGGLTKDPTALLFLFTAAVFTISYQMAEKGKDLLSILIARLLENQATKPIGEFLTKQKVLVFAALWFAVAFFAAPDRNKGMVALFGVTIVYVFHERSPTEFMTMALLLYAFFKINNPQVRLALVIAIMVVFWYYHEYVNKTPVDGEGVASGRYTPPTTRAPTVLN